MFFCPIIWCQQNLSSGKLVLQHLKEDHRSTDLSHGLISKMDNCFKSFSSYYGYRMHTFYIDVIETGKY